MYFNKFFLIYYRLCNDIPKYHTYARTIVFPWKEFRACKIRTIILIHIEATRTAFYFLLLRQNGDIAETYCRVLTNRWDFQWKQLQVFRMLWPMKITESQNSLMSRKGFKRFKSKSKQTLVNLSPITQIERLCETACTPIKVILCKYNQI